MIIHVPPSLMLFLVAVITNSLTTTTQAFHPSCTMSTTFGTTQRSPQSSTTEVHLSSTAIIIEDNSFVPPDSLNDYSISEPACAAAASMMRRVDVPVYESISPSGTVGISYIHWPSSSNSNKKTNTLPLLLIHGFDSSCLEFRRLGPALAARGIDTYAVDLLGWGYTRLQGVSDFSADAKVEALKSFWNVMGAGKDVCVGGASLGGAAAIEFATTTSNNDTPAKAAIMIDAQGFTDGIGPPSLLPPFLARLGVKVLKSESLRNSANQMSYFDKDTYATEDALKTGRMHCLYNEEWEDAQLSFIKSGGFYPSKKVKGITQKTLVLWGRDDNILDGKEYATQFMEELPDAQLRWIEECGHVPHLEQPEETASVIQEFLESDALLQSNTGESSNNLVPVGAAAAAAVGLAGAAATFLASN